MKLKRPLQWGFKMKKLFILTFCLFQLDLAFGKGFFIAINLKSKITSITRNDLKNIYLGKKTIWSEERVNALIVSQLKNSEFFQEILQKSYKQYKKHWRRKLYSGSGIPPIWLNSSEECLTQVSKTIGSIAILKEKKDFKGVKYISLEFD